MIPTSHAENGAASDRPERRLKWSDMHPCKETEEDEKKKYKLE
jgi:hypothetical protein